MSALAADLAADNDRLRHENDELRRALADIRALCRLGDPLQPDTLMDLIPTMRRSDET